MGVGLNVKRLREQRGWELAELARRSNIDLRTLYAMEIRDSDTTKFAVELAKAFGITVDQLLSDDTHVTTTHKRDSPTHFQESRLRGHINAGIVNVRQIGSSNKVPLVSLDIATRWLRMSAAFDPSSALKWVEVTRPVGASAFAVAAVGDSMHHQFDRRSIPDGAIVVIDPQQQAEHGDIVLAKFGEHVTLRQLTLDGNKPYLQPLNSAYPTVELTHDAEIIGKAVEKQIHDRL